MKNITLSAEEVLIRRARQKAQDENSSLNNRFREWLERYVGDDKSTFRDVMSKLDYAQSGKAFSRDELNER